MLIAAMLFVPGSDKRKLAKLDALHPDAFILDLEDSVADSQKVTARELVRETTLSYTGKSEVHVRVNSFGSEYLYQDLQEIVVAGLKGIVLPKVKYDYEIRAVDWVLGELEHSRALKVGDVEILPLIEDLQGLDNIDTIASSSRRIRRLGFGAHDFCSDIGIEPTCADVGTSPIVLYAKTQVAMASRRHALEPPHDGAFTQYQNTEGLIDEINRAKTLGFFGKHAIHPQQVSVIQREFSVSAASLREARAVVEKFESGLEDGLGSVSLNGTMIDYAVAERARKLLKYSELQTQSGEE